MPYKTGSWGSQQKARSIGRREYFRNYQKRRYIEKREQIAAYCKQWHIQNPEKVKAEKQAKNQIVIPKGQLCEDCHTSLAICRHHPDYTKPLVVKFLCASCHRKTMKKNNESEVIEIGD